MRCDVCAAIAQIVIEETSGYGYRYEGEVNQRGDMHGKGVYSRYGDRYVGEFRDNCYHGHGTLTYASGRVQSGMWENHNFLG